MVEPVKHDQKTNTRLYLEGHSQLVSGNNHDDCKSPIRGGCSPFQTA